MQQITLNFDRGIAESYSTCREFIGSLVHKQGRPQKAIAADMDYSPSQLTRKIAQSPKDNARFTLDDLELFIETTGDTKPVLYLVEKYFTKSDRIAELEKELATLKRAGGKS